MEFRCNAKIGSKPELTIPALRKEGYRAFVLAPSASESRKPDIPGASLAGVLWGVEFLRSIRNGTPLPLGRNVIVVGGGDVAVDAAISARKLGVEK